MHNCKFLQITACLIIKTGWKCPSKRKVKIGRYWDNFRYKNTFYPVFPVLWSSTSINHTSLSNVQAEWKFLASTWGWSFRCNLMVWNLLKFSSFYLRAMYGFMTQAAHFSVWFAFGHWRYNSERVVFKSHYSKRLYLSPIWFGWVSCIWLELILYIESWISMLSYTCRFFTQAPVPYFESTSGNHIQ